MIMLRVDNLKVSFGELNIVNGVSFSVEPGQWMMIVGPNGAGKSTIVNAISQGTAYTGDVFLEGRNVKTMPAKELAKALGVLSQSHQVSYSFSVDEVVRLGRYAYAPSIFSVKKGSDDDIIEKALKDTGLYDIRSQSVLTLSGGELQRTFLAQLFAQDPRLLILDEPTNHLDLVYQKQVFALIQKWIKDTGRCVLSVVHDLSLAKAYGTHAVLLDHGKVFASGKIDEVLTKNNLGAVYQMDVYGWMRDMYSAWQEEK